MVYRDIEESIYFFKYDKLKLYFSSKYYLNSFKEKYIEFIKGETIKLRNKYKCMICFDEMIILLLYQRIEKRGFRVYYNNMRLDKDYYIDMSFNLCSFTNKLN